MSKKSSKRKPKSFTVKDLDACLLDGTVTVPDDVTRIDKHAFAERDDIRHVYLGDSVEYIEMQAFFDLPSLETVSLPPAINLSSCYGSDRIGVMVSAFSYTSLKHLIVRQGAPFEHWYMESKLKRKSFAGKTPETITAPSISPYSFEKGALRDAAIVGYTASAEVGGEWVDGVREEYERILAGFPKPHDLVERMGGEVEGAGKIARSIRGRVYPSRVEYAIHKRTWSAERLLKKIEALEKKGVSEIDVVISFQPYTVYSEDETSIGNPDIRFKSLGEVFHGEHFEYALIEAVAEDGVGGRASLEELKTILSQIPEESQAAKIMITLADGTDESTPLRAFSELLVIGLDGANPQEVCGEKPEEATLWLAGGEIYIDPEP